MQFHTIHFLYLLNNMKQTPSFFIFLSTFLMAQSFNVVDSFHKNGLPKEIHHYTEANNKITLSQKSYYFFNGQKEKYGPFVAGRKDGLWTEWRNDGSRLIDGQYENGDKHGVWTHWNPEGRKIKQGRIKRGKKDGTWTKYTAKGHKLWGKEYLEGEQIDIKYSIKNVFK